MTIEEAFENLANGIVIRAACDWRELCKKIVNPQYRLKQMTEASVSFKELRNFFHSEWCATLCGSLDPQVILDALEREREAAISKHKEDIT